MQAFIERARGFLFEYKFLLIRLGVALTILVLIGTIYVLRNNQPTPGGIPEELQVREDDWVRGDHSLARTTLVEYSDFECPACGIYYSVLKQLEAETGSDLLVVYRHFPLSAIHPNAELAAQAAEAAGAQGKFFEMHDKLFEEQKVWSRNESPRELFIGYAKELGLDEGKFIDIMDDESTVRKITESVAEARLLGAKGTPTFFINGTLLPNAPTFAEFKQSVLQRIYGDSH